MHISCLYLNRALLELHRSTTVVHLRAEGHGWILQDPLLRVNIEANTNTQWYYIIKAMEKVTLKQMKLPFPH